MREKGCLYSYASIHRISKVLHFAKIFSHLPEEKTVYFLTGPGPYWALWKWFKVFKGHSTALDTVLHSGDVHCKIMVMEVQGEEKGICNNLLGRRCMQFKHDNCMKNYLFTSLFNFLTASVSIISSKNAKSAEQTIYTERNGIIILF